MITWRHKETIPLLIISTLGLVFISILFISKSIENVGMVLLTIMFISLILVGYRALCNLFNKTYVNFVEGNLTVTHTPLPFWSGNSFKYNIDNIEYIYNRRYIKTFEPYDLRVKFNDGVDKSLLRVLFLNYVGLNRIERILKEYLQLKDYHEVSEEYHVAPRKKLDLETQQIKPRFENENLEFIYHLLEDDCLVIDGERFIILSISPIDWGDSEYDIEFQTIDSKSKEHIFFVAVNNNTIEVYKENRIVLADMNAIQFSKTELTKEIVYLGRQFKLVSDKAGEIFINNNQKSKIVRQWLYKDLEEDTHIRICQLDDQWIYYYGQGVDERSLSNDVLHLPILTKEITKQHKLNKEK